MKVLIVHNCYRDRTGEDSVFNREANLLRSYGHSVHTWKVDNRNIRLQNFTDQVHLAKNTIWSKVAHQRLLRTLLELKPDIVHVHNILPLLSPAIFHACSKAKVPVIHTLHNYRLLCPSTTLFRDGKICEKCVSDTLINSVRHACYRNSRTQTAAVAAMLQYHRWKGTWRNKIDGYIALSKFQKSKLLHSGICEDKIYLKPNFIEDTPNPANIPKFGSYYLFVGRLIDEKGVQLLIESYQNAESDYPLIIMGPGYLKDMVVQAARENSQIKYVGVQEKSDVTEWMKDAIALLFPSVWHECSPMTILESFSCSLPVVSTDFGSITDMVKHEKTGYVFSPATSKELINAIQWIETHSKEWLSLKKNLAQNIDSIYFRTANYERLIEIYGLVIDKFSIYGNKDRNLRQPLATSPNLWR